MANSFRKTNNSYVKKIAMKKKTRYIPSLSLKTPIFLVKTYPLEHNLVNIYPGTKILYPG